jgi:hypothetical protein
MKQQSKEKGIILSLPCFMNFSESTNFLFLSLSLPDSELRYGDHWAHGVTRKWQG